MKGPLYLVSISATEEPDQVIRWQLELLHAQVCLCFWRLEIFPGFLSDMSMDKKNCLFLTPLCAMLQLVFYAAVPVGSFDHLTCIIFIFGCSSF